MTGPSVTGRPAAEVPPAGQPQPAGPPASPGNLLKQAALTWQRELGRRLRPIGLTPAQFFLLGGAGWLGRQGAAPSQQEVADFAGVDRMMASKVLVALAAAGLVERQPDPVDRRLSRLTVTAAGHQKRALAVLEVTRLDQEMFGHLDEARLMDELRDLSAFGDHPTDTVERSSTNRDHRG